MIIATIGKWEIETNPSRDLGYRILRTYRWEASPAPSPGNPDLLETAGDFITRQVLEKDSFLFEG